MLAASSISILFFIKDASFSSSPAISMTWTNPQGLLKSSKLSETKPPVHPAEEVMFILTKDANIHLICGNTGNMIIPRPRHLKKESIAISMYVTDGRISASKVSDANPPEEASKDTSTKNESMAGSSPIPIDPLEVEQDYNPENAYSEEGLLTQSNRHSFV